MRLGVLLWSACLLAACGGSAPDEPPPAPVTPAAPVLQPVPLPELTRLEPAVQDEIRRAHASLDEHAGSPQARAERYGKAGMLFHAHELFAPAEACYHNALTLAPDDFRWAVYLGYVQASQGQIDTAIASLERALRLRPQDLPVLVRLGELQLGAGRLDESRARFEAALAVNPRSAAALAGLGRIAVQERQFARAIEQLEQALTLAPWASSLHYPLAMAYRGRGELEKAEEEIAKRGEIRVGTADPLMDAVHEVAGAGKLVLRERGIRAARTAQWPEAVEQLREALAIDPDDVTTLQYLGGALWMSGDRAGAVAHYRRAAELDPASLQPRLSLGRIAALEGNDRTAVEHLEEAARLAPQSVAAWLHLAMARQRLRRFEPARAAYEEVLRLDPGNGYARLGRAFSLIALERFADARARLEEDVDVLPDQPVFRHTLARLLSAAPDPEVRDGARALALAEEVARELRSADVVETAAMAAAELGRYDDAVRWQQVAIEAARDAGRTDVVARLTEMLARYQSGQPCRTPWQPDDPAFAPAPLPLRFGEGDPSAADR